MEPELLVVIIHGLFVFAVNHCFRDQNTETLSSWTCAFTSLEKVKSSVRLKVTVQFGHILKFHPKAEHHKPFVSSVQLGLDV